MGLAVPDLPVSLSDDNIHMGDKDSVRRRALWALEGKPDVPYSKVEIPELSTLENEKAFEFRECTLISQLVRWFAHLHCSYQAFFPSWSRCWVSHHGEA